MREVLIIASLTLREAVRRRLIAAFAAITVALVCLSAWGFDNLSHTSSLTSGEVDAAIPQSLVLFMFMFSFVVALSASTMASPSISGEIESGVLHTIVTRPLRRSQVILGKWLGLAAVLLGYASVVSALEIGVVDWTSGYLARDPVAVALYLFAEGGILLTLALLLSTRLSSIAGGVIAVAMFGAAWLAGVVNAIGINFNIGALRTIGQVARYVLPTDGLWHGAIYYLEPQSLIVRRVAQGPGAGADPFLSLAPPSAAYLIWVAVWFLAVMAIALFSFEYREL